MFTMKDFGFAHKWRQEGKWQRLLLLSALPTLLFFFYLTRNGSYLSHYGQNSIFYHDSSPPLDTRMTDLIRTIWAPLLHPITAENFTYDDEVYQRKGPPRFTKPLGKKVLILDVDSRTLDSEGMLMNKKPQGWMQLKASSAGFMGHWMYAQIHGYDYKFVQPPGYADRWGTWVKVSMIRLALRHYDYVVFMDSDAAFNNFELPLEWLMNYWQIKPDTLAAMAEDPDEPQNYDTKGALNLNTGFQIVQKSERTDEMFKKWAECPLEKDYPGCGRWKFDFAHEQSAFSSFLRYDYNRTNDIVKLPCKEANGCPEAKHRGDSGCVGVFIRHYWQDKGLSLVGFGNSVMSGLVPQMHKQFLNNWNYNVVDVREKGLSGADLVDPVEGIEQR